MNTIVQKYGGSSVADIEKIKNIAKKIVVRKEQGTNLVIVVSAMGKSTNELIHMAKEISEAPNKREMDMLISTGEQVSIALLSMAIEELGYDAISLTGFQAGIKTEGIHTKNKILDINIEKIHELLKKNKIVIVAGFQGINNNGDITTLGRGGSDTTAVALAAKLNCPCEIYTDVDGIYSVDPRLYPQAKKLKAISYEEMMEMACLGAKVMEPRSVEIGQKFKIPIYVALNHGNIEGTFIKEFDKTMENKVITGLTASDNVLMVTISNIPNNCKIISNIFSELSQHEINIDMISQCAPLNGKSTVSFTTTKEASTIISNIIHNLKKSLIDLQVTLNENIIKLSVIGIGMINQPGVAAKIFKIFSENNIEFSQVTTSEISISYALASKDKEKAVYILAKELNL